MTHVSESIDIAVAAERLFPLFTDLETLPRMLSFIRSVEERGPGVTHWVVEFAKQQKALDVRLASQEPNRRLVWESATPGETFGIVATTTPLGPDETRVQIEADFDAGGMAERLGLAKGIASAALKGELKHAKQYAQRRFVDPVGA